MCTAPHTSVRFDLHHSNDSWTGSDRETLYAILQNTTQRIGVIALHEAPVYNGAMSRNTCEVVALSQGTLRDLEAWVEVAGFRYVFYALASYYRAEGYSSNPFELPFEFSDDWHENKRIVRTRLGRLSKEDQDPSLQFYNVMCIGWEADVAYRRGVGVVAKRAWDELGAKTITFKLG